MARFRGAIGRGGHIHTFLRCSSAAPAIAWGTFPENKDSYRRVLRVIAGVVISLGLVGCGRSRNLDGVYHGGPGSPITITIKGDKAAVLVGNESKTLDYKVEGNKLTIVNPREGDLVLAINDDGTLNSELGVLTKGKS